jgi:hypothetical protein
MQNEFHKTFTGSLTDPDGNTRHFINGALSRADDLPTIEYANGARAWHVENPKRGGFGQPSAVLHREGAPALIREDGRETYYRMGKLHREGGPAHTTADGIIQFWENDKCIKVIFPDGRVFEPK